MINQKTGGLMEYNNIQPFGLDFYQAMLLQQET
jgi:hypothetical protein